MINTLPYFFGRYPNEISLDLQHVLHFVTFGFSALHRLEQVKQRHFPNQQEL
ncbi:hypothetical protein [Vibrio gallaecicus]|uniref:hypothetical protein n=1 Tax=Vibrio gallaecicus TaxID=552386 RepID=UPI0025B43EFD|nr:hypothetical protein [Vibrio gallaecicus]MDN3617506.1 hypothetical protein [Vibrio gallaecicus]